jgi:glycosyltransferase involved in cell wall biosynthesis
MSGQWATAPIVSVIVPAYGRPSLVRRAVESVLGQDLPAHAFELIVVDSSPDDSVRDVVGPFLDRPDGPIVIYRRKRAEGPGPSRNLGVQLSRGTFVAFMDSDCVASPGWLRAGVAAFADGVGLVQGAVQPEAGARPGVFTHYLVIDRESYLYETANMFYRRATLDQVGGFQADLTPHAATPMGGEDVDLAWRAKRAGWRSAFAADALVYHAVLPIPISRWLVSRRLFIVPGLVGRFPELRQFFFTGYFYDRAHATLLLALAAVASAAWVPAALLLVLPYGVLRAAEPTGTLRGVLRVVRVAAYLPRDLAALAILLAGSVRFRTVLL